MKKLSRILIAGIVATALRYAINSGFGSLFADLYDPISGLWRAMMTPSWIQNIVFTDIIVSFLAVFAYVMVHKALGKKSDIGKKGLKFGFLAWFFRDIPGIILTFAFMPISLAVALSWILSGFVVSMINGQVIARIYK